MNFPVFFGYSFLLGLRVVQVTCYYKVNENRKILRLRRECPGDSCGAGVFMVKLLYSKANLFQGPLFSPFPGALGMRGCLQHQIFVCGNFDYFSFTLNVRNSTCRCYFCLFGCIRLQNPELNDCEILTL